MTVKRRIKKKLKQLFVIDVTPTTGVIFISVLAIIYFFVNTTVIATAMPLSLAGYKFFNLIGIDIINILNDPDLTSQIEKSFMDTPSLVLILGFAIGTIITELFQSDYKIEGLKSFKTQIMHAIGGLAVGFGVQGIYGANIGEVYGAISMLSLSGWLIIPCICIGILIGKPLYNKLKDKND